MLRIYWVELYDVEIVKRKGEIIRFDCFDTKWHCCPRPQPIIEKKEDFNSILSGNKFVNFNTLLKIARYANVPAGALRRAKRFIDRQLIESGTYMKYPVKKTDTYAIYLAAKLIDDEHVFKEEGLCQI